MKTKSHNQPNRRDAINRVSQQSILLLYAVAASSCKSINPVNPDSELYTHTLARFVPAQFNHPINFFTTHYKPMNIITLASYCLLPISIGMHNLCSSTAQFMHLSCTICTDFRTFFSKISN